MYRLIKLEEANDLRDFMHLACKCKNDVGVHTDENQIADAKSILGLMALLGKRWLSIRRLPATMEIIFMWEKISSQIMTAQLWTPAISGSEKTVFWARKSLFFR